MKEVQLRRTEQNNLQEEISSLRSKVLEFREEMVRDKKRIEQLEGEVESEQRMDVGQMLKKAEEEKNALLDYIQDTADRNATLSKQVGKVGGRRGYTYVGSICVCVCVFFYKR